MKRTFQLLLVTLALLVLSGCSFLKIYVPVDKPILVKPSSAMVVDCDVSKPPEPGSYISSTAADKEKKLYEYSSNLLNDLTNCNNQWKTLRTWYVDQKAIVEKEKK